RHRHHVGEAAAGLLKRLVQQAEDRLHPRFQIFRDVLALLVLCRRVAGEVDRLPALGDARRRIGPLLLMLALAHILGHDILLDDKTRIPAPGYRGRAPYLWLMCPEEPR